MAASSTWREGRVDLCRCWCESPWRSPWTAWTARDCPVLPVSGTRCVCPTDPDQSDTSLEKGEEIVILTARDCPGLPVSGTQCACPTDPDQSGTSLAERKRDCNIYIRLTGYIKLKFMKYCNLKVFENQNPVLLFHLNPILRDTGSRDRIQFFGQKWVVLGLTKNLYCNINILNWECQIWMSEIL